jgi:hypothetical protein
MDRYQNIRSSAGTNGTTASPICPERLELKFWLKREKRKLSIWKKMHRHHSKVGEPTLSSSAAPNELLSGAHQRLEKLKQRFTTIEE